MTDPTEPTTVTLRQRVRELQASTELSDPRDIADRIIADLTPHERTFALAEALPPYVRECLGASRMHARMPAPSSSAKVGAIRAWGERLLALSVDVSGEGGEWKRLADCTRDELLVVASYRRKQAERNVATAVQYEKLAARLDEADVATVADLTADDLADVFGRSA